MDGLRLRKADPSDLPAIAALFRCARETCLPFLPQLHSPEEDIEFFGDKIFPNHEMIVAELDGRIAGYSAASPGWLEQLYVLPKLQGLGAGTQLLTWVKQGQRRFQLHVFQKNLNARRFYERRGLRLVRLMDGAGNEEREPDALYEWRGGGGSC